MSFDHQPPYHLMKAPPTTSPKKQIPSNKIEHSNISPEDFSKKMKAFEVNLHELFSKSHSLETLISKNLTNLQHE